MEWQPISTAPKDGSEFLGYWDKSRVFDLIGWYANAFVDADNHEVSPPTHWMPLPEPPKD